MHPAKMHYFLDTFRYVTSNSMQQHGAVHAELLRFKEVITCENLWKIVLTYRIPSNRTPYKTQSSERFYLKGIQ